MRRLFYNCVCGSFSVQTKFVPGGFLPKGYLKLPYRKEYLVKRWNEGCYEAKKLFREIQQLGYSGSYKTVARYVRQLCEAQGWQPRQQPTYRKLPSVIDPKQPPLTARRAASLVMRRPEKHDSSSRQLIAQLMERPELSGAIDLAQSFAQLVRQRQTEQFDHWLLQAIQIQKAEGRRQKAEGSYVPTLKNVGLKQGRRISCCTLLEIHFYYFGGRYSHP